jgi:hypothetical protein
LLSKHLLRFRIELLQGLPLLLLLLLLLLGLLVLPSSCKVEYCLHLLLPDPLALLLRLQQGCKRAVAKALLVLLLLLQQLLPEQL